MYSPSMVRYESIRVLLVLTAVHNIELEQLDVKTTFLHGELQKQIYMTQPKGYKFLVKKIIYAC